MHVALLGDSTLDNGAYTAGGPSVIEYLNRKLPDGDKATLLAADGATTRDIEFQIDQIPLGVTHIVLSVGGNDALNEISVLENEVESVEEALALLSKTVRRFKRTYLGCVNLILETGLPTTACTIYNGAFDEPSGQQKIIDAALSLWNNTILEVALRRELPIVDLRRVCTSRDDFTRQIEPNEQGGRKIATALQQALTNQDSFSVPIGPAGH